MTEGSFQINSVMVADGIQAVKNLQDSSVHLVLSDIPYGIGADEWDVLHNNTNSALLGSSPAQVRAGGIFKRRGKPLNGWSEADREIPVEYLRWCQSFAPDWLRVLKPGGSALVFAGRRLSHRCVVAFEDAGFTFKDSLAWLRASAPHRAQRLSVVFQRRGDAASADKWEGWRVGNLRPTFEPILWFTKPYPIGTTIADNVLAHGLGAFNEGAFVRYERTPDNVLTSGFAQGEGGRHVAQKPVRLLRALIELTTLEGHVVLDPFCGSGSTLVAARAVGRRYLGFEVDTDSVRIANERLAQTILDASSEQTQSGAPSEPSECLALSFESAAEEVSCSPSEALGMEVGTIRSAGRSTQGVKLLNLEAGDEIASIERLSREEDAEETGKVQSNGDATSQVPPNDSAE